MESERTDVGPGLPIAVEPPHGPRHSTKTAIALGALLAVLAAAIFSLDRSLDFEAVCVSYVPIVVLAMWLPWQRAPLWTAAGATALIAVAHASRAATGDSALLREPVLTGLLLLTTGALCTYRMQSLLTSLALFDRSELFATIARNLCTPVTVQDATGRVRFWNPSAERLYGFDAGEACSMTGVELFAERHRERVADTFARVIETREALHMEATRIDNNQRPIDVEMTVVPLVGWNGDALGIATIDRDLEPERKSSYANHKLTYFDSLTSLPNRQNFQEKLDLALAAAREQRKLTALLFFDLDGFKEVNDALGHPAGDRLLCVVAERLMASVRRVDHVSQRAPAAPLISRLGGDEFTVILSEISSPKQAANVAKRMLDAIERPIDLLDQQVSVSASVGIAVYPYDGVDGETLVRNADTAMYEAKKGGRGRCAYYSAGMNRELKRKLEVAASLRRALDAGSLELHFQPVLDLESESIVGAEALVRLTDPDLGSISPEEFIPIAEESDSIIRLGEWVLRTACAEAAAWQSRSERPVWVAVNLSTHQLRLDHLEDLVPAALAECELAPELLELEITESAVVESERNAIRILEALRERGIRVCLDDFGTGYSSLGRLQSLPIDRLKIDRSFLRKIDREPDGGALAEVIVAMSRVLGVTVVAEGVESERQLEFLREQRCDLAQGFLLGRPMPAEHFVSLLEPGKGADEPECAL